MEFQIKITKRVKPAWINNPDYVVEQLSKTTISIPNSNYFLHLYFIEALSYEGKGESSFAHPNVINLKCSTSSSCAMFSNDKKMPTFKEQNNHFIHEMGNYNVEIITKHSVANL